MKIFHFRIQVDAVLFFVSLVLLFEQSVTAQVLPPRYPDSLFSAYYHQRLTHFRSLPATKGDIIFIGNSITDGGEWSELFNDVKMKNRGISGDVTAGVLNRITEVAQRRPSKVFLLIGTNDLARGISADSVAKNILFIASYLKQECPSTQLYIQSILPVSNAFNRFSSHTNKTAKIREVNKKLMLQAASNGYTFLDLFTPFADQDGKLKAELTNDGLHLTGKGYLLWKHLLYASVYGLQQTPSLIPQPQKLQWNNTYFPLYACKNIVISHSSIRNEAAQLQAALQEKGLSIGVKEKKESGEKNIILRLAKVASPMLTEEAYTIDVAENEVVLTANTPHGIFNGVQTLLQLAGSGVMINTCSISDWPSFAWRGYMIDVGRNYMSMDLLKEQIDVMAAYKLNVFHFHPTEDIAWRVASKLYPQLTAPEHMLRNKGMYYTEAEMKELILYCKERHMTFVPEIDMPGHSAAFSRAMNTEMQSDSGIAIVKNILKELCATHDVPYIHIGADEVKITNQQFIPEITALLESLGKKVIGWEPGGNFNDKTIRQLWMDDNGRITGRRNIQYIDSRHLYLNHMDPLETVVTIFNRKIGNKEKGDSSTLGGTICMWHDRAAAKEDDVLRMNAVYPAMLVFAERSWRGSGKDGWIANINEGDVKAFAEFENRLLDHKAIHFKEKPFAYVRQSNLTWQLYGPFANGGITKKKFDLESPGFDEANTKPYKEVSGGTIVLRHWWANLIKGAIAEPEDSTTWYATSKIWSNEQGEKKFWIGFNNLSRSPATDSPPVGAWDDKGSTVWMNGKRISPPQWKRGGQKGHAEIPLLDEGYEFREPTKIHLQKGWNTVLVKLPIGKFSGRDWQNPVKWMFTFVPVD